jgi:prepilin-type N-terminal cleavage/methylation domain-containing protein
MISVTGKNEALDLLNCKADAERPILRPRTHKGFTLIEIMISVSILSLGLILIMQGLAKCVNILRISQSNLAATLLAEDKMAEMEIAAKQDGAKAFLGDTSGEEKSGNLELNWQIRLTPDEGYENLNRILATVRWKDGRNNGSSVLSTYLTIFNDK